jgi:hypothetical protein
MVGGRNGNLIGDLNSQCLPSERPVKELIEENGNLQFGMEGGGEKMESSSVSFEGERRSPGRQLGIMTAALMSRQSEEIANLMSEFREMR